MSEIAVQAFKKIFPLKELPQIEINYSGKFKDYNANVKFIGNKGNYTKLYFSLSKKFSDVDEDIKIGLIQHLINKVYSTNVSTMEQEFYHSFIKNLSRYVERKESDPLL